MPLPKGIITIWSGAIADIPGGWALCDGTLGTPDLRDRFIIGAGSTFAPDATGGAATHSHPFTTDGHFHTLTVAFTNATGMGLSGTTTTDTDTGNTNAVSSYPPYYALAYIMKT